MSGKQMKKLRRAMKAAGVATRGEEYFIVGNKRSVPLTEKMRNNALARIARITDFNERTEAIRKLPPVGTKVELVLNRHVVCDEKRRMYKEYKKVLREKNKGGNDGSKAVRDDIERNTRSNPLGAVSPDGEGAGVSEHPGSDAPAHEAQVCERPAAELV